MCPAADSLTTAGHLAGRLPASAGSGLRSSSPAPHGPAAANQSDLPSCATSGRMCTRHARPRPQSIITEWPNDRRPIVWTKDGPRRVDHLPRLLRYAGASWRMTHPAMPTNGIKRVSSTKREPDRDVDRRPDRRRWAKVKNLDGWARLWTDLLSVDPAK